MTTATSSPPDRLHYTGDEEADRLLVAEPMALLIGFALDQQVTVEKAFSGPMELKRRIGTLDPARLAAHDPAELTAAFRKPPALHRYPAAMAARVQALAQHIATEYGGDASRVWRDAGSPEELRANLQALPGFGEMKVKALAAVLAKRFGVAAAEQLVPWHPTLGDVDSPEALADYQAAKRAHKQEWKKAQARG